jgi:putative spermidine/putrescine transport system permease protein
MTVTPNPLRSLGELSRPKRGARYGLILPMGLVFLVIVFAPLAILALQSVEGTGAGRAITLANYGRIFQDAYTLQILLATVRLGVVTTMVVAIISYPIAMALLFATPRQRAWLIFLVILPLLTSTVVRTFAWIVILGRDGPLNALLITSGITDEPLQVLFTELGVVIALIQIELPLMILPLATSLIQINRNLLSASRSLGAGRWRMFRKIIVPLSLPGLLAGCTLVFASSVSAFITQAVIGGGKRVYMPLLIYQQATDVNDLPAASALAILLLFTVCLAVVLLGLLGRASRKAQHV